MPVLPDQRPATRGAPERKAVLFCPRCGREEPVDGNWNISTALDRETYVCPRCRTIVLSQPKL